MQKISGCGIYIIKWDNCPHFYIGKSTNIHKRINYHKSFFDRNFHTQKKLESTFQTYGHPNYDVLEYCTKEDLDDKEYKYLLLHQDNPYSLNTRHYNKETPLQKSVGILLTNKEYTVFHTLLKNGMKRREALIECFKTKNEMKHKCFIS